MFRSMKGLSHAHFVGIGGAGMSGIAEVLLDYDLEVSGCDAGRGEAIARLESLGVKVWQGHSPEHLDGVDLVVKSSAVTDDNEEIRAARARGITVVRRAEMLGELMRLKWAIAVAGTHGKTTTTSLIAALLDAAKLDPTVINGGIINAYGTNARHGKGDWMVVEADESDGTFVRLPASAAVVTNIDPEHMEFYGQFDAVRAAFQSFVENIPFYGFATLCIDHPEVQALFGRITDRRLISYGFSPQADVRALAAKLKGLHALLTPAEQALLQTVLHRAAGCAPAVPDVDGVIWAVRFNPFPYLDAIAAEEFQAIPRSPMDWAPRWPPTNK